MANTHSPRRVRSSNRWLWMMVAFLVIGLMGATQGGGDSGQVRAAGSHAAAWYPFSFLGAQYTGFEKFALIANVIIALLGLGYAAMLMKEVWSAETGTPSMQEIARA